MKKKLIISALIVGILSALFTFLYHFRFDITSMYSYLTTENKSLVVDEAELICFEKQNDNLLSTCEDAQIIFDDVNQFIGNIEINLTDLNIKNDELVVYYTNKKNNAFIPDYSEKVILKSETNQYSLNLNRYVNGIRIDLGSQEQQNFNIESISLKNNNPFFNINRFSLTQYFLIFVIFMFIALHFIFDIKKMYTWIFDNRYYIAIGIFIVGILLELNGSSIDMWRKYVDLEEQGVIFGRARGIRSDEWATFTSVTLSKQYSNFSYFNDILRGTMTDTFALNGTPTLDIVSIFKPFNWGYIFLGSSKGYSFLWMGKIVALCLVSFELCLIITKNNKLYSLFGMVLLSFAPLVQWFFMTPIVELMIYSFTALVLFTKYFDTENSLIRFLYIFIILICAGCCLLTFYPSWIIPFVYFILLFIIWYWIENKQHMKFKKIDVLAIVITTVIFVGLIARIFLLSQETLAAITTTVYPGERFETGGGYNIELLSSIGTLFFSIKNYSGNTSEQALFVDFFPLGIIVVLFVLIKFKKKDTFSYFMIGYSIFLLIWMTIGFPEFLAKITLMSNVQPNRAAAVFGIINIFILLRGLVLFKEVKVTKKYWIVLSVVLSGIIAFSTYYFYRGFISLKLVPFVFALFLCTSLVFILKKRSKQIVMAILITTLLGFGLMVNPIQQSTDVIEKSTIGNEIREINTLNSGLWLVEGEGLPMNNFLPIFGAATINSTNVYPTIERWREFDPTGAYDYVYNRYAHIQPVLYEEEQAEKFSLLVPDAFQVNLVREDLVTLNVKYILTKNDLTKFNNDKIQFIEKYEHTDGYKIYQLEY